MTACWALTLDRSDAHSLGSIRLRSAIEVREDGELLWVRGSSNETHDILMHLPARERFAAAPDGRITPLGLRVPTGRLPESGWQPLSDWLRLAPQASILPGAIQNRAQLRLLRSDLEHEASAMTATFADWARWVDGAPAVRLRPLCFTVSGGETPLAMIRGRPLPPLPGCRFWETDGILVPCGSVWAPPVDTAVLRKVLGLQPGELGILAPGGSFERLDPALFAPAMRSAVRASAASMQT